MRTNKSENMINERGKKNSKNLSVILRSGHADLWLQLQTYSNSFNQHVDESSQEEDEGEDAGPLDNDLLVYAQNL